MQLHFNETCRQTFFLWITHTVRPGMCIEEVNGHFSVSWWLVIGNYIDLERCFPTVVLEYPNSRHFGCLPFLTPISEDEQAEAGMFDYGDIQSM